MSAVKSGLKIFVLCESINGWYGHRTWNHRYIHWPNRECILFFYTDKCMGNKKLVFYSSEKFHQPIFRISYRHVWIMSITTAGWLAARCELWKTSIYSQKINAWKFPENKIKKWEKKRLEGFSLIEEQWRSCCI